MDQQILILGALITILSAAVFLLFKSRKKIQSAYQELAKKQQDTVEELQKYLPIKNIEQRTAELENVKDRLEQELKNIETRIDELSVDISIKEMGYYHPKFEFDDILKYAEALELIRDAQKALIKAKEVVLPLDEQSASSKFKTWKNMGVIGLNAFNSMSTKVMESVTYNNFEKSKDKLRIEYNKLNELLAPFGVFISEQYLELKVKEMAVAYDFKEHEQKVKEEQAELKEMMREEEKARVEAEKARDKAIEEEKKYEEAMEKVRSELEGKSEEERAKYESEIKVLQEKLEEVHRERERATSMAQITKKGHVYIISNIGSFGENIYKIGMTRRKEPMDRVKELGDASVPFTFDVHAIIYTDDAPGLEKALHRKFNECRMNKVNERKEFFKVHLDEISAACQELGCQARLTKAAEAREYRETLEIERSSESQREIAA